jgi:hypothetical protein
METKFSEQFRQILEALMKAAPLKFVTDRDYILLTIWFVHCQTLPRGKKLNARGNYAHFVNAVLKTLAAECPEMLVLGGLLAKKNVRQLWTQKVGRKIREGWSKWLNSIAAGRAPAKYTDRERAVKAIFNALGPNLQMKAEINAVALPKMPFEDAMQEAIARIWKEIQDGKDVLFMTEDGTLRFAPGPKPGQGKMRDLLERASRKAAPLPVLEKKTASEVNLFHLLALREVTDAARARGVAFMAELHSRLNSVSREDAARLFPGATSKQMRNARPWVEEQLRRHLA